jgi:uncharacterized membrane protein
MSLIRKEVKEGPYKGHIILHDEESGIIHHQIPHHMLPYHMLKFYPKDVLQVIIGACLLAFPISFEERVSTLGRNLPIENIIFVMGTSILFVAAFIFYHYYRHSIKEHSFEFFARTFTTYLLSFLVVSFLLTVIGIVHWNGDLAIDAFKIVTLVTFPASMSAAVADVLK